MKVVLAMCEGPHDVSFLSRIMRVKGFHTYNELINDYPPFIADFLRNKITKGNLRDLNLKEARGGLFLPSFALLKDDNLLLLFQLKGDSKKDARKDIVSSFNTLFMNAEMTKSILRDNDSLSIIYVYDADQKGVERRIEEINMELSEFLNLGRSIHIDQKSFDIANGIKYGAYIFNDPNNQDGGGRLEDLVLPMMCCSNDDVYADVNTLIAKRNERAYRLFAEPLAKKDKDYDEQKAAIGIMGQLQKSGSANSAIIEQSSFITDDDICRSVSCNEVLTFFDQSFGA